jgi:replicative DNA helicase
MATMSHIAEKLLPQNIEAEAGVLGSLLIDPEAVVQVAGFLRPDDFYRETHRMIFQAMLDLYESGGPADLITLTDELARRGKLDEIGGVSYVSSLANQVPTSRNVLRYARIVERTATLRRLIDAAGQIAGVAYNEPDADDAISQAEELIAAVAAGRAGATRHAARPVGAGLSALIDRMEALQRGDAALRGVATGARALDRMLGGGLHRADLVILAARPSVGKTALALSIAEVAAARGQTVALFSLEMSEEQVLHRVLAMRAHVDVQALRTGALSDEDWRAVYAAAPGVTDLPLVVDDTPGLSIADLAARAKRLMRERPYDLLIVDYLQLMAGGSGAHGDGAARSENRQQEVSVISRGLKGLARTLDVPVLALSQLSRAVEGRAEKKPQLSDLRESGSIEQDADVVMFIYRDEIYNPNTDRRHIADILVAKQRNGPIGQVSLYFQASETRYRDLELRMPGGGTYDSSGGNDLPYSDD